MPVFAPCTWQTLCVFGIGIIPRGAFCAFCAAIRRNAIGGARITISRAFIGLVFSRCTFGTITSLDSRISPWRTERAFIVASSFSYLSGITFIASIWLGPAHSSCWAIHTCMEDAVRVLSGRAWFTSIWTCWRHLPPPAWIAHAVVASCTSSGMGGFPTNRHILSSTPGQIWLSTCLCASRLKRT